MEREVWAKFDLNNDAELTVEEAKPAVKFLIANLRGLNIKREFTDYEFKELFNEVDVNGSGTIDKAELRNFTLKLASKGNIAGVFDTKSLQEEIKRRSSSPILYKSQ